MTLTNLLDEIKNGLEMLIKREPEFTGSLALEIHFKKGDALEVFKSVEKTRQPLRATGMPTSGMVKWPKYKKGKRPQPTLTE